MINKIKDEIKSSVEDYILINYHITSNVLIEEPKKMDLGDLSIPLFSLAKILKKNPNELYIELKKIVENNQVVDNTKFANGFCNIEIDKKQLSYDILQKVQKENKNYGNSNIGLGKTIVLDYSSPNIAKPFSIGHLRSTIIGMSLNRLYQKSGFKTVSINHLGDWGTQFGKVIVAYKKWGKQEDVKNNSLYELSKLYVKFHDYLKIDPAIELEAREVFNQLERGNKEYLKLWEWFREESLKDAQTLYKRLGVTFDSNLGEAFFNDKMDKVIAELKEKKLLVEDQGAQVVFLDDLMPPALIKRSDGASLYITRDLAAVFYRKKEYQFTKCLYVVGNEQRLHFNQLKNVVKKMGYSFYDDIEHINFGLVLKDGKKMSTRLGGVITLDDVLNDSYQAALKVINEKNPLIENKEILAENIGIGAIIFNDLKNFRTLDIDFNLETMLKFEGQTGPYLQYTAVRITSILRENKLENNIDYSVYQKNHYYEIVKLIDNYQDIILSSINENAPSIMAKYLLSLAQAFNAFYGIERLICEDDSIKAANLLLASATKIVLEDGMYLVGLKPLERM